MNPPAGSRAGSRSLDEGRGEESASGYPSKRVRMSPSAATSNTASGTVEASPANSTSTYLGASPGSVHAHPENINSEFATPQLDRQNSEAHTENSETQSALHTGEGLEKVENKLAPKTGSSSFRNVSACNRCRLRKNRCDQRLPSCASCGKAGVRCTGYDQIGRAHV